METNVFKRLRMGAGANHRGGLDSREQAPGFAAFQAWQQRVLFDEGLI
jgi:hypothetical protein